MPGIRNFMQMIQAQHDEGKFVCVGLDPQWDKIPKHIKKGKTHQVAIFDFLAMIVQQTKDIVCAYKPNIAFFEAHGKNGLQTLADIIEFIKLEAPKVPIILDAKRADIGKTNIGYVDMAFDWMMADAITVHPYLGKEALEPFLIQKNKGIIVLCRTSNPGAGEFQDLPVEVGGIQVPVYQIVARHVAVHWNNNGNCLVVTGATYPEELGFIRKMIGDMPMLIPGIGTQGGNVEKTVQNGKNSRGQGMIINSSSGIIHASPEEDFAEVAREKTLELHNEIRKYLGLPAEVLV